MMDPPMDSRYVLKVPSEHIITVPVKRVKYFFTGTCSSFCKEKQAKETAMTGSGANTASPSPLPLSAGFFGSFFTKQK
jgi:hypothetical protein